MLTTIILIIVFFCGGWILGVVSYRERLRKNASGTINVSKFPDKTLYSLELNGDPEELEDKKEVVFTVHIPE